MGSETLWRSHPPLPFLMRNRWNQQILLHVGNVHRDLCAQILSRRRVHICNKGRGEALLKFPMFRNYVCLLWIPSIKKQGESCFPWSEWVRRQLWPAVSMGFQNRLMKSFLPSLEWQPGRLTEARGWHSGCLSQSPGAKWQFWVPAPFVPVRMPSFPQWEAAEKVNLGTPRCCLRLGVPGLWNSFYRSPCLGPLAFLPLWWKGVQVQNSQERKGSSLFWAIMPMCSKKHHHRGRHNPRGPGRNFSPVQQQPTPHGEPTPEVIATLYASIRRGFSKLPLGISVGRYSQIPSSPKVNSPHKQSLQSKSKPLERLQIVLNPK